MMGRATPNGLPTDADVRPEAGRSLLYAFEPRQPDPHQYGNVRLPRTVSMHAEGGSTATACSVSYPLGYESSHRLNDRGDGDV
jgi:hypothetical protein